MHAQFEETPLLAAARCGYKEIVAMLLKKKVDFTIKNKVNIGAKSYCTLDWCLLRLVL